MVLLQLAATTAAAAVQRHILEGIHLPFEKRMQHHHHHHHNSTRTNNTPDDANQQYC